ncbi:MAG: ABC transporter permease [Thermoproteota archaeon]|nr:ABC transporter permease [Thermoproteota archaeon]
MMLVLFATLLITVMLLGPTLDKILLENVRTQVVDEVNQGNLKFQNPSSRQSYIDNQIMYKTNTLGLNEKWYSPSKLLSKLSSVVSLDLGKSHFFTTDVGSSNVRDIIFEKVPKTLLLFTSATIIVTIIGILLGTFVAGKSGSFWDKINSIFAIFSNSFPSWWIAMIMIFLFAFTLHVFPARATPTTSPSDPSYPLNLVYHMLLPLLTITFVSFGSWAYIVRYFLINILKEDYIFAKRTIGISKRKILYSHALRNAAPPIITTVALSLASSFGGSIIVEAVFDWPGMGKLYYDAIGFLDIPVIIGLTYISTLIFIVTIFITDISYAFFDPRVKML